MRIKLTSVFVDDQAKALKFYTEVLGFVKKSDVSAGEYRWLTVVSPDGPDDLELVLEPNGNPASLAYQASIYQQGIPATILYSADVRADYERMKAMGVRFVSEPIQEPWGTRVVFDDTCGNLILLRQG